MGNVLVATKGAKNSWAKINGTWYELETWAQGTCSFTKGSKTVIGHNTFWDERYKGREIKNDNDGTWYVIESVDAPDRISLSVAYAGESTDQESYTISNLGNLFYVMVESDYAYGVFDDGIRQSTNGLTWTPHPPDPLWSLPSSEGIARNAVPIPRGFLIGAKRGLWIFLGGGSAVNLWLFPEYANTDNFRGMDKFGNYALFSVENQGLFYTNGSGVYPTNLTWRSEPFAVKSCKSILTSGWDMFALVSDGTDWYFARSCMENTSTPKYWHIVKKLSKTPQYLSSYSDTRVFIHYEDGSCEKYNKVSGPYQSSGYLETSLVDENLVLLQKFYRSISLLFSEFPKDTSATLAFRLDESSAYSGKSFTGGGALSQDFRLPNPTLGNRIQIKAVLETSDITKSPVATDICWKYILERPTEEVNRKRNWHMRVIAEDSLEKLSGTPEELGLEAPRTRQEIVDRLWEIASKQEILNFVGAENELKRAFKLKYKGSGDSCICKIDKTNNEMTLEVDGKIDQILSYGDKTIRTFVSEINALSDYKATIDPAVPQNTSAENLMPCRDLQIKGGAQIYYGTDVHAVILSSQAPGQYKLALEGRGSDRINISLREV